MDRSNSDPPRPFLRARGAASLAVGLVLFLLVAPGRAAGSSASELDRLRESGRVDPAVVDALETAERVRVLVVFSLPEGADRARREIRRDGGARRQLRALLAARRDAILKTLSAEDLELRRSYGAINAFAATVNAGAIAGLLGSPHLLSVSLDTKVRAQLGQSVPLVNLDQLHSRGRKGGGARIAIVDTGVDLLHQDLDGAVVAEQCFCSGPEGPEGCCPNDLDTDSGTGAAQDDNGHGTRVAGVAVSRGKRSAVGAAPEAEIVAIKVMDSGGVGDASDVLQALDWIATSRPDVDLVNLSLGSGSYAGDCDGADAGTIAYAAAIGTLRANGVVTVAGTGNDGWGTAMLSPACVAGALSVGAVWDEDGGAIAMHGCIDSPTWADQVTCYSNSSATTDLFAPGSLIHMSNLGGGVTSSGGTSYATAMATGCAAVLLGVDPSVDPDTLEAALEHSPTLVTDATNGLSFPRVDCLAAREWLAQRRLPSLTGPGLFALLALLSGAGLWSLRRRASTPPDGA